MSSAPGIAFQILQSVFVVLAAMDIGTSFGGLGARREMLIGFLAEPAMLMTLFTAAFISGSTQLTTIVDTLAHREFALYPSLAFAAVAFLMVLLAENARIPIDNPTTHLELTMVHEALILEYSARHLALIEWAVAIKLFAYMTIGIALFAPWGIADAGDWSALPYAFAALAGKLALAGAGLALIETLLAKLRLFRALGHRDPPQHSDDHADRDRPGDIRLRPGHPDFADGDHAHALDAGDRPRERAAFLPHDDRAPESGAAGHRFSGHGERSLLRRHQRHLRHAARGRVGRGARRAGRHLHIRNIFLPYPRALRQPRHPAYGKAQGGLAWKSR